MSASRLCPLHSLHLLPLDAMTKRVERGQLAWTTWTHWKDKEELDGYADDSLYRAKLCGPLKLFAMICPSTWVLLAGDSLLDMNGI